MKRLLAILFLATAASAGTFTTYEAIEYASPAGEALLMDLRVPDGRGPHPVILYLHSGAWITGNREGGPAIRQASRGYAVASIDYRLAPAHIWPAQVEDAKAAVRWLRANAARFDLDPNRIGVFGASAGGHIAAVLGTSGGVESLEWIELGCPIQQCKEKTATANPITYVTKDDPPFLIMHGMLDCLVPWKQSAILHEALEKTGVDSRLILISNGEHGGRQFDTPANKQAVDDFLDKHLRAPVAKKRRAVR